jgi:hypothetical protein
MSFLRFLETDIWLPSMEMEAFNMEMKLLELYTLNPPKYPQRMSAIGQYNRMLLNI